MRRFVTIAFKSVGLSWISLRRSQCLSISSSICNAHSWVHRIKRSSKPKRVTISNQPSIWPLGNQNSNNVMSSKDLRKIKTTLFSIPHNHEFPLYDFVNSWEPNNIKEEENQNIISSFLFLNYSLIKRIINCKFKSNNRRNSHGKMARTKLRH